MKLGHILNRENNVYRREREIRCETALAQSMLRHYLSARILNMIATKTSKIGERKIRQGVVSLPKVDSERLAAEWRAAGITSEGAIRMALSIGLTAALTRKD